MPVGLLALALGGFGIGLTEVVMMGLLPDLAADFGVSEAAAGGLSITVGLGYTSPIWAGAGVAMLGFAVMLAAARGARRQASVAPPEAPEYTDAAPAAAEEPARSDLPSVANSGHPRPGRREPRGPVRRIHPAGPDLLS